MKTINPFKANTTVKVVFANVEGERGFEASYNSSLDEYNVLIWNDFSKEVYRCSMSVDDLQRFQDTCVLEWNTQEDAENWYRVYRPLAVA